MKILKQMSEQQIGLWLWCLPRSLYFNFRYLPFSQAIRLPFWIGPKVKLVSMGGKVSVEGPLYRAMIEIGIGYADFYDARFTPSLWLVKGTVIFKGQARLGPGFRLAVGKGGKATFGNQFKITADAAVNCRQEITFGENVIIAWGTQISDTDWHEIVDEKGTCLNPDRPVSIGNNVWIGTNVVVLQGTRLADGCILAAGAVIKGEHLVPNSLLGGVPAKVIKKGVRWVR
ncbi:MAG: acyltransferase [Anaerolineales bacterium]|nr:acyltransferase [Anaerolineales bacterium]